jgi:hypothetical protein
VGTPPFPPCRAPGPSGLGYSRLLALSAQPREFGFERLRALFRLQPRLALGLSGLALGVSIFLGSAD